MSGILRSTRVRLILSSLFQKVQQWLGVSVTPAHFYFPVPNLKSFEGKDWAASHCCSRVDFDLQGQIARLESQLVPFADEWTFPEVSTGVDSEFHFNNGFFERIDAEVAYSFVREHKPKRIIEVGSGNTTRLLAAALRKNTAEGFPGELITIEPYPAPFLKQGFPGLTKLLVQPVQSVALDLFRTLQANDVLFIDSTHVVAMDSDVLYECLRILPELAPGVLVHFHDIFTPLDYPKKFVMTNLCFWGEQYLLEAFLSFNSGYRVLWSGSAMQHFHPDVLRRNFSAWEGSFTRMPADLKVFVPSLCGNNVWPCSFWIVRN